MPVPAADPPTALLPLRLDVALTPPATPIPPAPLESAARLYPVHANAPRDETVYVVVDVIRATTSLCMLFERGCARVLVAPDVVAARVLAPELDRSLDPEHGPRVLLAGEISGARPDGFDYGNSPAELAQASVKGRIMLFATTNGTRAIRACAGGRAILAGSLRNAQAVAHAALAAVPVEGTTLSPTVTKTDDAAERFDIVIVCSGRDDQPAYDDTICAGFILRCLMDAAAARGRAVALESGAQIALATLEGVEARGGIRAALAQSGAYRAIERIGLAGDLDWCAAIDVTAVVPRVVGYSSGHDLIVMRAPKIERSR